MDLLKRYSPALFFLIFGIFGSPYVAAAIMEYDYPTWGAAAWGMLWTVVFGGIGTYLLNKV